MKMKISKYVLVGGMVLGCTGLASASDIFNYAGMASVGPGMNSVPTLTVNGVTSTEWGVWANYDNSGATVVKNAANAYGGSAPASSNFAVTDDAIYSGNGLAVCNPNQQNPAVNPNGFCGSPDHQISNYHGMDFAMFGFSAAVSLSSVQVQSYGNPTGSGSDDVDLSYAILTSAQETALINGTLGFTSITFTTVNTADLSSDVYSLSGTVGGSGGNYLLVGAAVTPYYGDGSAGAATPDAFKIQDVTATTVVSPVPEPASVFMIGSGLLAIAFFGRRRLNKKATAQA